MRLSLDSLQVLDAIDRKGSFAAAADELHRVPSAITYSVKQVARGWESELRIALDTIIATDRLYRTVADFYGKESGTRVRLGHEVLGGTWDALASGRADLAIGASGELPAGRSFTTRYLGSVHMRFVAAPFHPICESPQPLDEAT